LYTSFGLGAGKCGEYQVQLLKCEVCQRSFSILIENRIDRVHLAGLGYEQAQAFYTRAGWASRREAKAVSLGGGLSVILLPVVPNKGKVPGTQSNPVPDLRALIAKPSPEPPPKHTCRTPQGPPVKTSYSFVTIQNNFANYTESKLGCNQRAGERFT
jgi:hypothetical protein